MSDWIRAQVGRGGADKPGPLQLAWIGDAVWELHQRLRLGSRPGRSDALHKAVVAEVRADAQSNLLAWLEQQNLLHDDELDLVRRGRNSAGRGPRRADPAVYGRATGFETMVGWLFLNNPVRLAELLDQLEMAGSNSITPPPTP